MDGIETIQDYSMIDEFISRNLDDFNKKLFGSYDENTGYFDEYEPEQEEEQNVFIPDETENQSQEERDQNQMSDEEQLYNYLFGPDFEVPQNFQYAQEEDVQQGPGGDYNGEIRSSGEFGTRNIGNYGKQIYGQVAGFLGYSPVANSIYRSKAQNDALIAKGKPASKNSYHLTGNAVDFKPADWNKLSASQKAYMKKNYDVIYHDNHYHVEPKQAGGMPVARTKAQQYTGLNNGSMNELFLPLQGQNPIRGLDSGEPVYVQDAEGNADVLYGPQDVTFMTGGVYEKRLSKKYKTRK